MLAKMTNTTFMHVKVGVGSIDKYLFSHKCNIDFILLCSSLQLDTLQ